MRHHITAILILSTLFIQTSQLHADTYVSESLASENHSPFISGLMLPQANYLLMRQPGTITLHSQLDVTNYISKTSLPKEAIAIDGESWELRSGFSYQINKQMVVSAYTAYVRHYGGKLDRFIYDFHDILSLPQNGRSNLAHDRLRWQVVHEGEVVSDLNTEKQSWSDLVLSFSWQPSLLETQQWSASVKVSNPSASRYVSSGNIDINLTFSDVNPDWFVNRNVLSDISLAVWYGAGLGYIGKIDALSGLDQHPVVASFRSGIAWRPLSPWEIKLQIDTHTPIFQSNLREFGWVPLQFTIGTKIDFNKHADYTFFIVEDLRPRTAPDVTFNSTFNYRF